MKFYKRKDKYGFTQIDFFSELIPHPLGFFLEKKILRKVFKRRRLKDSFLNILLDGLISGIPICCILYYLKLSEEERIAEGGGLNLCYIPCPYCTENGKVKMINTIEVFR